MCTGCGICVSMPEEMQIDEAGSARPLLQIVDDIAFPDEKGERPELAPGRKFFRHMRNLTLTGYYTSQMGITDLGYSGNRPNVWDGVPEDVLKEHDVTYEEDWLAKCIDQSTRNDTAA